MELPVNNLFLGERRQKICQNLFRGKNSSAGFTGRFWGKGNECFFFQGKDCFFSPSLLPIPPSIISKRDLNTALKNVFYCNQKVS